MQLTVNWGPQAGTAGTGTFESLFGPVGLIDLISDQFYTVQSVSPTTLVSTGTIDGELITFRLNGIGFQPTSATSVDAVGDITSIQYFAGSSLSDSQNIVTIEVGFPITTLIELLEQESGFGDAGAFERFYDTFDFVYNGTGFADNFFAGFRSDDGAPIRLRGNDIINLAGGNDNFFAGDGNDTVNGDGGFDTIRGGADDDLIDGGAQADLLYGGSGNDNLIGGLGFDVLYGESGDDTLNGGETPDRLYGGSGNDLLMAGSNFSLTVDGVFGEDGDDTLYGEAGYDLLNGGEGDDYLDGGHQADNLLGGTGNDTMYGGLGLDRLFGGDDDDIGYGGAGTDGMFGELGNDTLYGEDGNDRFFGGAGNDVIYGGADMDTIFAGAGFDTIDGGTGDDLLLGNFNADTFVFQDGHSNDTIADFTTAGNIERIDLGAVTAITSFTDLMDNHIGMAQDGDVLIDTGSGNSILLSGVQEGALNSLDFLF